MTVNAVAKVRSVRDENSADLSAVNASAANADARPLSAAVIGLGYVGAVSVGCLSKLGVKVVGVDVEADRVAAIAGGKSPIAEPGLDELLAAGVAQGRIQASADLAAAVGACDVTVVMVGTPSREDGSCDLSYVEEVSRSIGRAIAKKREHHVVVLRCSVPPGTTEEVVTPLIEETSGKRLGDGFSIAFCPEFLREGAAIRDFFACSRTVIGASDEIAADMVRRLLGDIETVFVTTGIKAAETIKYVDNVWHATKVVFGNEVGRVCRQLGLDSHEVMNVFVQDTKLNISPAYLKPGFAFGGSCLPKDVRAFCRLAKDRGVDIPLIASIIPSNRAQVAEALNVLAPFRGKKHLFLGVAFKSGTDDIRESPVLEVVKALVDGGEHVRVHDQCWPPKGAAATRGASDIDLAARVASLAGGDLPSLVSEADVIIVSHATDAYREAVKQRRPGCAVLDLVRFYKEKSGMADYRGISW